jgi:hypothetical protein
LDRIARAAPAASSDTNAIQRGKLDRADHYPRGESHYPFG